MNGQNILIQSEDHSIIQWFSPLIQDQVINTEVEPNYINVTKEQTGVDLISSSHLMNI